MRIGWGKGYGGVSAREGTSGEDVCRRVARESGVGATEEGV
jgi:hypothetical protein